MTMPCLRLVVPDSLCYLAFVASPFASDHSTEIGTTVRGETVVADYDPTGRILGFELIAPGMKPCQQEESPSGDLAHEDLVGHNDRTLINWRVAMAEELTKFAEVASLKRRSDDPT